VLLVILGAGASYDSAPSRPITNGNYQSMVNRPPLADQLFDDRDYFGDIMNKYPQCLPVIPRLQNISSGSSVEKELQRLQSEATNYPDRLCQLAAIRYYLQEVLSDLPNAWLKETHSVTNYLVLVDHIKQWKQPNERVCIVTFNYDTLLDKALEHFGYALGDLKSYIQKDLQLIKIHGSVNWGRFSSAPISLVGTRQEIAERMIDAYAPEFIMKEFVMIGESPPAVRDNRPVFPALAIPVESKLDFECPPNHVEALKSFLPAVTKVLIIGWRATEKPFLDLLSGRVKMADLVTVVNGDKSRGDAAADNLRSARLLASRYHTFDGGFTEFFGSGAAAPFFGLS